MNSPKVFVSLEALCIRMGDRSPAVHIVEEYMPVGPILEGRDAGGRAVEYFLSRTDAVSDVQEVRSFKVNGREFLRTFMT